MPGFIVAAAVIGAPGHTIAFVFINEVIMRRRIKKAHIIFRKIRCQFSYLDIQLQYLPKSDMENYLTLVLVKAIKK